jgi:hypothetical protein
MAQALDQLVQLIPHPPRRVTAFGEFFKTESAHRSKSAHRSNADSSKSLAARIEFANGAQAEIDIRLDSPAPLWTGWVLHSDRSGFADDRRYTLTSDGEVFDSSAPSSSDVPIPDDLIHLASALRSDTDDELVTRQSRAVVQLLDAMRRSNESQSNESQCSVEVTR